MSVEGVPHLAAATASRSVGTCSSPSPAVALLLLFYHGPRSSATVSHGAHDRLYHQLPVRLDQFFNLGPCRSRSYQSVRSEFIASPLPGDPVLSLADAQMPRVSSAAPSRRLPGVRFSFRHCLKNCPIGYRRSAPTRPTPAEHRYPSRVAAEFAYSAGSKLPPHLQDSLPTP